jgi:hypothetical protein
MNKADNLLVCVCVWGGGLFIALRPQTLKHIRGDWSLYTGTSEPVDGNGAQYGHCPMRNSNQGLRI